MSLWTALSELFLSTDHLSWILDLTLHLFPSVLFKAGLCMLLGIRTYSSGVHTSETVPRKCITWMLWSRSWCSSQSQMRWGSGGRCKSCTCRGDLPVCLNEGSNARKQWRWMTLSSCLTDVWLSTAPPLFPFHQRPLIIPSTERPKAVPTAAFLNDHGNTSTASTFGNDLMEIILAWEKDWWGNPCSSCTYLHWQLNSRAAVPSFPRTDFFPVKKNYLLEQLILKCCFW